MDFLFDNEKPIYKQIVEKIKRLIVSGEYQKGEKLPSVREYAMMLQVNPNTVQRALVDLETMGLIYTQRTNGKYVTEEEEIIFHIKNELANQKVDFFIKEMQEIGFSKQETMEYVKKRSES